MALLVAPAPPGILGEVRKGGRGDRVSPGHVFCPGPTCPFHGPRAYGRPGPILVVRLADRCRRETNSPLREFLPTPGWVVHLLRSGISWPGHLPRAGRGR